MKKKIIASALTLSAFLPNAHALDLMGAYEGALASDPTFRAAVMDSFADSYARGQTPVPCVECNKTVKFTDLLALAQGLGAEALLTGHYVQRLDGPDGPELHRGADPAKDQSYFLWTTTQAQLDYLRFPLGGLAKAVVRGEADIYLHTGGQYEWDNCAPAAVALAAALAPS